VDQQRITLDEWRDFVFPLALARYGRGDDLGDSVIAAFRDYTACRHGGAGTAPFAVFQASRSDDRVEVHFEDDATGVMGPRQS